METAMYKYVETVWKVTCKHNYGFEEGAFYSNEWRARHAAQMLDIDNLLNAPGGAVLTKATVAEVVKQAGMKIRD
jgi:hypothetical protein